MKGWLERQKGLCLAVLLRGQAQEVLGNLGGGVSHDYSILVERFLPANQMELYRV